MHTVVVDVVVLWHHGMRGMQHLPRSIAAAASLI